MNIFVFETDGRWAAATRTLAEAALRQNSVLRLREVRGTSELFELLRTSTPAVVAWSVELRTFDADVRGLRQAAANRPDVAIVALVERDCPLRCQDALREAGAAHVVVSIRSAADIVKIAVRHLAAQPLADFNAEADDLQELELRELVLGRLPW